MKQITQNNFCEVLQAARRPWHDGYYAFWSSLWNGVTTDPVLMQVPVDDHLVHRGDGVFDTFICRGGAVYNLDAHLARLERSAAALGLVWSGGCEGIRARTLETLRAAGRPDCCGRVMLARGPGSFGISPYDSPEPALYIMVYRSPEPFMRLHPEGASVRRSTVPVKAAQYASVKSCNYLPNVFMKREAVDWGVDFVATFDGAGNLAEGATENFGIVTVDGELAFPRLEHVLAGTTMLRLVELARGAIADGVLKRVVFRDIPETEVRSAAEMLVVGTMIGVVSVRAYEGAAIGSGVPGPAGCDLATRLERDMTVETAMRTVFHGC